MTKTQLNLEERVANLEDIPRQIYLALSLLAIVGGISSVSISFFAISQFNSQVQAWINSSCIHSGVCPSFQSMNPSIQEPFWAFPGIVIGAYAILFGIIGAGINRTRADKHE